MSIFFRAFEGRDLKKILEIERVSFPDPWSEGGFLYHYHNHPEGFKVAVSEGRVVGYAVARIGMAFEVKKLKIYKRCHLANLAVDPEYRGRGIGSRLLKEIIEYAKSNKVREVYLEVRAKNVCARKFYEKKGFTEKGLKKGYYNDDDAIIMAVSLEPTQ